MYANSSKFSKEFPLTIFNLKTPDEKDVEESSLHMWRLIVRKSADFFWYKDTYTFSYVVPYTNASLFGIEGYTQSFRSTYKAWLNSRFHWLTQHATIHIPSLQVLYQRAVAFELQEIKRQNENLQEFMFRKGILVDDILKLIFDYQMYIFHGDCLVLMDDIVKYQPMDDKFNQVVFCKFLHGFLEEKFERWFGKSPYKYEWLNNESV